jgi:hypothetical protein
VRPTAPFERRSGARSGRSPGHGSKGQPRREAGAQRRRSQLAETARLPKPAPAPTAPDLRVRRTGGQTAVKELRDRAVAGQAPRGRVPIRHHGKRAEDAAGGSTTPVVVRSAARPRDPQGPGAPGRCPCDPHVLTRCERRRHT